MALKIICDLCESDEPEISVVTVYTAKDMQTRPEPFHAARDICLTCLGKLQKWLDGDAVIEDE